MSQDLRYSNQEWPAGLGKRNGCLHDVSSLRFSRRLAQAGWQTYSGGILKTPAQRILHCFGRTGQTRAISQPTNAALKTLLNPTTIWLFCSAFAFSPAIHCHAESPPPAVQVVRFETNPIIRPEMLPGRDGENINGPSLIRVPAWLPNPLGKYYLYFAHHGGKYIRLAYADDLAGPWKIHEPGALRLADAPWCKSHIASPDAIVDDARKEIRLYFHGPARSGDGQKTYIATSPDGLHFKATDKVLGIFYWRVFRWDGWWYAMAKGGLLYRSPDGLKDFVKGPNPFPSAQRDEEANSPGVRHVAVKLDGSRLWVYYSNIGDAPERILRRCVELTGDWTKWKASEPEEVLRPAKEWDGALLPVTTSVSGAMKGRENALRDPAIFIEGNRTYLLYSVAGESGIAIAEILAAGGAAGKP